ncbi:enoyl-CoA hydratase [Minwuia thermotolerans]|uniref:Enoyl-CoA hydratase n=1 Tax=Minwuia thermotolerans TaxID=2056226 RepID=A0A2M9G6Z5_9PROT|nr:enoyl-CoA hydratase [Minwuia thermotolerans]PJK31485.1 enoyl-CoA hydratase [Minwuia thermotolerans]
MTDHLLVERKGGVAVMTMNRPDRLNALSGEMLDALVANARAFAADPEVRCVVITGAGRGFCAGGDVKSMAEGKEFADDSIQGKANALREKMEISRLLHEMPKPTIAMVRGPLAGAGMSIALACDLRIASDTLKFTTAFANVGYSGDFGGSYFLSHLVGTAKARELYFTAEKLDAQQALALGIVNRVVPDSELETATMELAQRLASGPSVAFAYMKRNMNAAENEPLARCFDMEALHHTLAGQTEDHKAAAQAFVEKRTPVFKGR